MSQFFDKVGEVAGIVADKAVELAKLAADKTQRLARIARLNVDISSQRDDIERAYTALGELYYNGAPTEDLGEISARIDAANAAIADLQAQIETLRDAPASEEDEPEAPVEPEVPAEPEAPVEPEASDEPEVPAEPME